MRKEQLLKSCSACLTYLNQISILPPVWLAYQAHTTHHLPTQNNWTSSLSPAFASPPGALAPTHRPSVATPPNRSCAAQTGGTREAKERPEACTFLRLQSALLLDLLSPLFVDIHALRSHGRTRSGVPAPSIYTSYLAVSRPSIRRAHPGHPLLINQLDPGLPSSPVPVPARSSPDKSFAAQQPCKKVNNLGRRRRQRKSPAQQGDPAPPPDQDCVWPREARRN